MASCTVSVQRVGQRHLLLLHMLPNWRVLEGDLTEIPHAVTAAAGVAQSLIKLNGVSTQVKPHPPTSELS
jgi:hypothetical protein